MARDIDRIIERLEAEIAGLSVTQLQVPHPGVDDDGLWFVNIPDSEETIQMESSEGNCPFLIESDFGPERASGRSIDEVVHTVKRLLNS